MLSDILNTAHKACDEAGARPPKVTQYANCIAIIFRNGDGHKVLVTVSHDARPEDVAHKIKTAFKVKAGNIPSEETLAKLRNETVSLKDGRITKD